MKSILKMAIAVFLGMWLFTLSVIILFTLFTIFTIGSIRLPDLSNTNFSGTQTAVYSTLPQGTQDTILNSGPIAVPSETPTPISEIGPSPTFLPSFTPTP